MIIRSMKCHDGETKLNVFQDAGNTCIESVEGEREHLILSLTKTETQEFIKILQESIS